MSVSSVGSCNIDLKTHSTGADCFNASILYLQPAVYHLNINHQSILKMTDHL
jgi:hypothetical protein